MDLKNAIKTEVNTLFKRLVKIRRHIHAHPELSFQEKNTSAYVEQILNENDIKYQKGFCKYGIVAEIQGSKKGETVYLRGDMDALPITEKNTVAYKSVVEGVMHACGHDVHTTCVLGSAIVLNKLKDQIKGTIKIIFQPGEEKLPGGASIMIKEGAISSTKNASILAQHVHPPLEVGKVGFHAGEYMASADEIYLEVIGKGGHAALPNNFTDTILVSSQIISALHTVVSRYSNPQVPSVLSFGKIYSDGGATNVIPDRVHVLGTLRTMDEKNRMELHGVIKHMAKHTALAYGAKVKTKINYGYPTLYNNIELTNSSIEHAREFLGNKNVVLLEKRMTAEDFSYFSQMMPACFYRLGTGNKSKGIVSPVHTPTFNIDEKAIKIGVGLMSYLAIKTLV